MNEQKAISEKLNQPPHILPQLIDIVTGEQQYTSAEQEQRWQHLARCMYCQAFTGIYLLEVIESEVEPGSSKERARKLLIKLTSVMHRVLAVDIPPYVEMFVEQGGERAHQQFPMLGEHLPTCQACQAEVQNLYTWLRYIEQIRSAQRAGEN